MPKVGIVYLDEQFTQGRVVAPQGGPGVRSVLAADSRAAVFLVGDILWSASPLGPRKAEVGPTGLSPTVRTVWRSGIQPPGGVGGR